MNISEKSLVEYVCQKFKIQIIFVLFKSKNSILKIKVVWGYILIFYKYNIFY